MIRSNLSRPRFRRYKRRAISSITGLVIVFDSAAKAYQEFLIGWVARAHRLAWLVIIAALALSVASIAYLSENIRINTATTDMLSEELPFRQHARALSQAFPQFSDNIVVVIDGQTPELADDAARALSDQLRQRPELFGDVYDPAGSDFFRRHGLLYLDVDELYDLSDRLAEAQPFLGTLWRDPSLRGLVHMLGLAINEAVKGDGDSPIEIAGVLGAIADVADAQVAGKFHQLSWRDLMSGGDVGGADGRRFLLIQPALDFGSLQPASQALSAIRALAAELKLDAAHGTKVRLTGSAALAQEELQSVETGMSLAGIVSLTLVLSLLAIGFRSLPLVVATLITLIAGLIWTAAFAIVALGSLNLISVAFAVLFIGLSVDFGIHFGLRYQEEASKGATHAQALEQAAPAVGGPLTLCAISAAIAFYSFLPTDYNGLAELGLIAGTGMFIALAANLTLLPALLSVMPARPGTEPSAADASSWGSSFHDLIRRRCRLICVIAVAVGLGAAAVATKARFDFDPLNLKDPKTESVATLFDIMSDQRTNPYSIEILAAGLDAADVLAARLDALPEVKSAVTVSSYVPSDQDEKLEVIAGTALFLAPSLAVAKTDAPAGPPERAAALDDLRAHLTRYAGLDGQDAGTASAERLLAALSALAEGGDGPLSELEHRLLSGLPSQLRLLKQSLSAGNVSLDELPGDVWQRAIAEDGRARIEVFPTHDLRDRVALEQFVAAVRTVAPDAIGSPVVILEAGNAVVAAFIEAASIAIAAIAILLAVVLRRTVDVALVFAPLVLAAAMTVAASVLLGLPFNFANVIVLPLLFGLGVAGGIHLVSRQREEAQGQGNGKVMATSTPRAVVFSALTTIGSFGSIALSGHPGTSSMGILLSVSIILTLASTLIFLPALMALTKGDGPTERTP